MPASRRAASKRSRPGPSQPRRRTGPGRQRQQAAPGQQFGGLPVVRGEEAAERPVQRRGIVFLKQQRERRVAVGRGKVVAPAVEQIGDHLVLPEPECVATAVENAAFFQAGPDFAAGGEGRAVPPECREIRFRIAADPGAQRVAVSGPEERFVVLRVPGDRGEHAEILGDHTVVRRDQFGSPAAEIGAEKLPPDRP